MAGERREYDDADNAQYQLKDFQGSLRLSVGCVGLLHNINRLRNRHVNFDVRLNGCARAKRNPGGVARRGEKGERRRKGFSY